MPFLAALRRRSVYDLERDVNGFGREIWVAALALAGLSQGKNPAILPAQPSVWYEFNSKGIKIRRERDAIGININTLGPGPYL